MRVVRNDTDKHVSLLFVSTSDMTTHNTTPYRFISFIFSSVHVPTTAPPEPGNLAAPSCSLAIYPFHHNNTKYLHHMDVLLLDHSISKHLTTKLEVLLEQLFKALIIVVIQRFHSLIRVTRKSTSRMKETFFFSLQTRIFFHSVINSLVSIQPLLFHLRVNFTRLQALRSHPKQTHTSLGWAQ